MNRLFLFLLGTILQFNIHGQTNEDGKSGTATVYIFRASLHAGLSDFKDLYIDNQYVGEVRNNKYLKLSLEPGEHLLWVRHAFPAYIQMNLTANETYIVAVSVNTHKWKTHYRLFDFADYADMAECHDCYQRGIDRLKKLISKGREFKFSVKDKEKNQKKKRKKITEGLEKYRKGDTKWEIEILDTPINIQL